MIRTWTVDPLPEWLRINEQWLLGANLPNTPRCAATLTDHQCELKQGHTCSHAITLNVLTDLMATLSET